MQFPKAGPNTIQPKVSIFQLDFKIASHRYRYPSPMNKSPSIVAQKTAETPMEFLAGSSGIIRRGCLRKTCSHYTAAGTEKKKRSESTS